MLPNTFAALEKWDGKELPDEASYKAFYEDFYPLAIKRIWKIISEIKL